MDDDIFDTVEPYQWRHVVFGSVLHAVQRVDDGMPDVTHVALCGNGWKYQTRWLGDLPSEQERVRRMRRCQHCIKRLERQQ